MNELYRAEDGTLRRRGTPENHRAAVPSHQSNPHSDRKAFFAIYCVFLCIALCGALYTNIATESTGNDLIDGIMPFAMIAGGALACIIYGCGGAKESGYTLGTFFAVTFFAALGALVAFWIFSFIPMIFSGLKYILIGIVAIGIICGLIGG